MLFVIFPHLYCVIWYRECVQNIVMVEELVVDAYRNVPIKTSS